MRHGVRLSGATAQRARLTRSLSRVLLTPGRLRANVPHTAGLLAQEWWNGLAEEYQSTYYQSGTQASAPVGPPVG